MSCKTAALLSSLIALVALPVSAGAAVTEEQFLDAVYKNCAEVENRDVKSCDCERKLIGDRVAAEDKEMVYFYYAEKEKFKTEFEKRSKADPAWQPAFAERMSIMGAYITAACTVRRR